MSRLLDGLAGLQGLFAPADLHRGGRVAREPACTEVDARRRAIRRDWAAPAAGIAEALGADRDQRGADVEQVAAHARRSAPRPCRSPGCRTRAGDGGDLGQRDGPDRRAREPAGAAAQPRRRAGAVAPGASAIARSVLISETASAPPSWAAGAQAATSAVLGVSLTISGLAVRGRTASHDLLELAPGRRRCRGRSRRWGRTRSARSPRSPGAASQRLQRARADLAGGRAHDVGDQRARRGLAAGRAPRRM